MSFVRWVMSESHERLVIDNFGTNAGTMGVRYWHDGLAVEMRLAQYSRPEPHYRVQQMMHRQIVVMGKMGHKQAARGKAMLDQISPIFDKLLELYQYQPYQYQMGLREVDAYQAADRHPCLLPGGEMPLLLEVLEVAAKAVPQFVYKLKMIRGTAVIVGDTARPTKQQQIETTVQAYRHGLIDAGVAANTLMGLVADDGRGPKAVKIAGEHVRP